MSSALHHVELWTGDLAAVEQAWGWLLGRLGWRDGDAWDRGRTWTYTDGTYLVLEQSPAVTDEVHDRLRAGMNHLALHAPTSAVLDDVRADAAAHGWCEMFAERYPHAGGPAHRALFLENEQGFEIEIVAPPA
ncbi:VOC family protein [Nocardioides bruguierae]|uniref:Glyoxalase n=1 Tax=Nocardioides bruguierae TaxID=2945102 RepID=A0A9X2D9N5_9ACTN|nr:VOC family protein [Nocardioides bruguierae]MCM0621913.1 glyoxalase [Nocardioides bruguierae]